MTFALASPQLVCRNTRQQCDAERSAKRPERGDRQRRYEGPAQYDEVPHIDAPGLQAVPHHLVGDDVGDAIAIDITGGRAVAQGVAGIAPHQAVGAVDPGHAQHTGGGNGSEVDGGGPALGLAKEDVECPRPAAPLGRVVGRRNAQVRMAIAIVVTLERGVRRDVSLGGAKDVGDHETDRW
jgi:hypothetical protein